MDSKSKSAFILLGVLGLAWMPVLLDAGAVGEAAALSPPPPGSTPYLVPSHAVLLYLRVPLVAVSAAVLVLTPGLLLALAFGRGDSVDRWVVYGLGLSLVLIGIVTSTLTVLGIAPTGRGFSLLLAALSLGIFAILLRVRLSRLSAPGDARPAVVATYLVPAVLLVACLAPKFLWESFNGDGAHAFEASRLLLERPLPFWDPAAGGVSRFPGLTTMLFAFPGSWFIRMFGEVEAAVRLPFVLHLSALYAAIVALVRARKGRVLGRADRWLVWLGLGAYALAMAFSATYNPYHADIALPGAQDTLFLACFLGFLLAFAEDDRAGIVLFLFLAMAALPSWIALVALWLIAVLLVWRPLPVRPLSWTVGSTAVAMVGLAVAPAVLARLSLPLPGAEHAGAQLIERLRFVRLVDWQRWLYLIIPGGILPALYLVAWRRQDRVARALALVAVGYFLLFYVQAFTSLHHFLPAAVLAIPVMWRDGAGGAARRRLRGSALVLGIVALVLSLPAHGRIHLQGKRVGYAVQDHRGGYHSFDPAIFASSELYWRLFTRVVDPAVPDRRYGGSPLVWNYYAHHAPATRPPAAYLWAPVAGEAPAGAVRVGRESGHALYVLDGEAWQRDRTFREESSVGKLFAMPKNVLFRSVGLRGDEGVVDLVALMRRMKGGRP